jgi:hypothetical protein
VSKLVRLPAALRAVYLGCAGLPACGGDEISGDAVAVVGSSLITKATFYRMKVKASNSEVETAKKRLATDHHQRGALDTAWQSDADSTPKSSHHPNAGVVKPLQIPRFKGTLRRLLIRKRSQVRILDRPLVPPT